MPQSASDYVAHWISDRLTGGAKAPAPSAPTPVVADKPIVRSSNPIGPLRPLGASYGKDINLPREKK